LLAQAPEARRIGWQTPPGQAFRLFLRRNPPGQDWFIYSAFQEQQKRCTQATGKREEAARQLLTSCCFWTTRNCRSGHGYLWRFQHGSDRVSQWNELAILKEKFVWRNGQIQRKTAMTPASTDL
jgi:hypothetical protein